jgi:hypothetical protein
MSKSSSIATPESTKDSKSTSVAPISAKKPAPEREVDTVSTVGDRLVSGVGGNSPQTPPTHFATLLNNSRGSPSTQAATLRQLQRRYGNTYVGMVIQAKLEVNQPSDLEEEEEMLQGKFTASETPVQLQGDVGEPENRTGMPRPLKTGLEVLSGIDLSGVRVHNNSSKPAQLNALAYTQGQEIHVAPGQEKHLPHEGWHAVQQMQGRVKPTMQTKGVSINDDADLEQEADVMGAKALQTKGAEQATTGSARRGTKGESEVHREAIGTSGEKVRLNLQSTSLQGDVRLEKAVLQREQDAKTRYKNEDEFVRVARGLFTSGRLTRGATIHRDKYWGATAVGLSPHSFYVGLPSDMGTIVHVYNFTSADGAFEHHEVLVDNPVPDSVEAALEPAEREKVAPRAKASEVTSANLVNAEDVAGIIAEQMQMWYMASRFGIENANLKGNDDAAKYFLLALGGNLVWAASSFVAPEAVIAIRAMSVAGATVGSGTLEKLASEDLPIEKFRDKAKDSLGKAYASLKSPELTAALKGIYVASGLMDSNNEKQAEERRRLAWKYLFHSEIGYKNPADLENRAKADIEAIWKDFLIDYKSLHTIITPTFIRKDLGKYILVSYYRAMVSSGVADRSVGVKKTKVYIMGGDKGFFTVEGDEVIYAFPGGATAKKTSYPQHIWFGNITATVP